MPKKIVEKSNPLPEKRMRKPNKKYSEDEKQLTQKVSFNISDDSLLFFLVFDVLLKRTNWHAE